MQTEGLGKVYATFMIRRVLRIFPIYYLVLLIVWLAKFNSFLPEITTDFYTHPIYYLFYLSNYLLEKTDNWSDILSPFWSLAVEEQFYIFWPLIMLTVHQKYLKLVIILTIISGIIFRFILFKTGYELGILMPGCIDTFAIGALWALVYFNEKYSKILLKYLNIITIPAFIVFIIFSIFPANEVLDILFFRVLMAICCLFLVANATSDNGFKSPFGSVLDNNVFRFIGKISYGLYIFHMLVPAFVLPIIITGINRFFGINFHLTDSLYKIVSLIILITLATLSWYFFEMPFNRLKRRFTGLAGN